MLTILVRYMELDSITQHQLQTIRTWLGSGSINIFGLPFSGKDTHGHKLAELFDATLLGGGDILRNSEIAPDVKQAIDSGKLAPTDVYIKVVLPYLSRDEFTGKPMILSSVGRWSGEEVGVLEATKSSGHETKAVIYLHLDESVAHARRARSEKLGDRSERKDDVKEVLDTRIEEFNLKTIPVIAAYRTHRMLIEVNSNASKDQVLDTILARLYARATAELI